MAKAKRKAVKRPPAKRPRRAPAQEWIGLDTVAPYSDMVRLTTGERGVMLTFGQLQPDANNIQVVGRVVMPPKTAGELLAILVQQVSVYEQNYGKIMPENLDINILVEAETE